MRWTTIILACLGAVSSPVLGCPIERAWGLDQALQGAFSHWDLGPFKQAHVLAWQSMKDDRPLYFEECIAVIERQKGWVLIRLFRHPKEKGGWELAMVNDAPQTPFVQYARKPTKEDLLSFLKSSWWSFEPSGTFHIIRSGICEAELKSLFGSVTFDEMKRANQSSKGR